MEDGYEDLLPKGKKVSAPVADDGYSDLLPKPKRTRRGHPSDVAYGGGFTPFIPDVPANLGPPVISGDIGKGRSGKNPLSPAQVQRMQQDALRLAASPMTAGLPPHTPRHPSDVAYNARPEQQGIQRTKDGRVGVRAVAQGKDVPSSTHAIAAMQRVPVDPRARAMAMMGSGDPQMAAAGLYQFLTLGAQGGADSVQTGAHAAAAPIAEGIARKLPNGLLRKSLEEDMRKLGFGGKVTAETLKNLDPTQVPQFIAQITQEHGPGAAGVAAGFKELFRRAATGDEDAAAQLLGMGYAAGVGSAAGAEFKALLPGRMPKPHVAGRMGVKEIPAVRAPEGVRLNVRGVPTRTVKARGRAIGPEEVPQVPEPAPPAQGPTSIHHAGVSQLRRDLGWAPSPKTTKTDAQLAQEATKFRGKEDIIADHITGDSKGGASLSDTQSVALGRRLAELKREMQGAKARNDVEAFDLADASAQKIADALDTSGSRQGRALRARRFLFDGMEDSWTINRRAKKANQDVPLSQKRQGKLDTIVRDLEKANADLKAERDAAVKNLDLFKESQLSKRSKGPLTPERRRQEALASLKRLGVPVSEDFPNATPSTGGMRSKKSGAISIPQGSTEQVARGVRSLVRSYTFDGANDWKGVMSRLQRDLPGIEEDQALFILSGKYKVAKIEADIAKKKTNAFLRDVQAEAEFRAKSTLQKGAHYLWQPTGQLMRTMQTTLDDSLALIQGKNVLASNPGTWFKAVGKSLQGSFRKDPIAFARRHITEIENEPLYAKAVQAKLALSDVDGPINKQEEFFAGKLENHVPLIANSKAAATVLGNEMRFDLFRKFAATLPKDAPAEAYADIAQLINVMTGKGSGNLADWLGRKEAGAVIYAPRFYLSKVQHNFGQPIWAAKTTAGRKIAAKAYARQLAAYGAAFGVFHAFGWDVDYDPRSATFGRAFNRDRTRSIDLFYQQSEGYRVAAQLLYGRTSQKGNYSSPGDYGGYGPGEYLESKASPGLRAALTFTTGKTYDDDTGKFRDARWSDFWGMYIPLSIKEMSKNRDNPATWPVSFMGGGVDIPRSSTAPAKPSWEPTPPGLKTLLKKD